MGPKCQSKCLARHLAPEGPAIQNGPRRSSSQAHQRDKFMTHFAAATKLFHCAKLDEQKKIDSS